MLKATYRRLFSSIDNSLKFLAYTFLLSMSLSISTLDALSWISIQLGTEEFVIPNQGQVDILYNPEPNVLASYTYKTNEGKTTFGTKELISEQKNSDRYSYHHIKQNTSENDLDCRYYYTSKANGDLTEKRISQWKSWDIFKPSSELRQLYNSKNQKINQTLVHPGILDDEILEIRTYSYNSLDKLQKVSIQDQFNEEQSHLEIFYDFNGDISTIAQYDKDHQITYSQKRAYNLDLGIHEYLYFDSANKLIRSELKFFDEDILQQIRYHDEQGTLEKTLSVHYGDNLRVNTYLFTDPQEAVLARFNFSYDSHHRVIKIAYWIRDDLIKDYKSLLSQILHLSDLSMTKVPSVTSSKISSL